MIHVAECPVSGEMVRELVGDDELRLNTEEVDLERVSGVISGAQSTGGVWEKNPRQTKIISLMTTKCIIFYYIFLKN